jgi:hypothetical protein
MNEVNALLAELTEDLFSMRNPKTGRRIEIEGGRRYRYYRAGGWMHCYTTHPDTEGNYWTWSYKPIGPGARTKPKRWKAVRLVSARRRKVAEHRAWWRARPKSAPRPKADPEPYEPEPAAQERAAVLRDAEDESLENLEAAEKIYDDLKAGKR